MKWVSRVVAMGISGMIAMKVAQALIVLPPAPSAADFQFSGLLIIGGNVLFAVLDFQLAQFNDRTAQLAALAALQHTRVARELRQKTLEVRRSISAVVTIVTLCKGIGAICGILITQRALAPGHYLQARDLGFFTLGAAFPGIFILWRSVRKAEAVVEATTRYFEDERERKVHLEALRPARMDPAAKPDSE